MSKEGIIDNVEEKNDVIEEIDFQITTTTKALNLKPILSKNTHQNIAHQPSNWVATFIKEIEFLKANNFVYSIPNGIRSCNKWSVTKLLAIYPQKTFTFKNVNSRATKNRIRRMKLNEWRELLEILNKYECFDVDKEKITKKSLMCLSSGLTEIAHLFYVHNIEIKAYEWSISDQAIDGEEFDKIRRGEKDNSISNEFMSVEFENDNYSTPGDSDCDIFQETTPVANQNWFKKNNKRPRAEFDTENSENMKKHRPKKKRKRNDSEFCAAEIEKKLKIYQL